EDARARVLPRDRFELRQIAIAREQLFADALLRRDGILQEEARLSIVFLHLDARQRLGVRDALGQRGVRVVDVRLLIGERGVELLAAVVLLHLLRRASKARVELARPKARVHERRDVVAQEDAEERTAARLAAKTEHVRARPGDANAGLIGGELLLA